MDLVLDVYGGPPYETFIDIPCCSGSAWEITPVAGGYRIRSQDSATLPLTTNDSGTNVFLGAVTGNDGVWTITALGDGAFRLTNNALGAGLSLAITSNVLSASPFMALTDPNAVGQRWKISP